jgi:hypothetical protein
MRVPQVNERVKEAPASALRAMFAGIGSLLSVTDKIRPKPAAETAPEPKAAAPETTETPETPAGPADTAAPDTTETPETIATPEDAAAPEAAPASDEAAALPLANYDELSIASLRARLRNLSADQLTVLISYEKSHADRADVISMFERRITKLALGLTQTLPKLTE